MVLATPGELEENPALVWRFYSYGRHMSLNAKPNAARYAFAAEYGRHKTGLPILGILPPRAVLCIRQKLPPSGVSSWYWLWLYPRVDKLPLVPNS